MSDTTISIRLNFFGPNIGKREFTNILKNNEDEVSKALLNTFFKLPLDALDEETINRFVELKDANLPIMPHNEKIFEKITKPLKHAKKSYCLGNYLGAIAICGLVGEMTAILIWKINEENIANGEMDKKRQKSVFGDEFEKLGQYRRITVLSGLGLITAEEKKILDSLRTTRKNYLHFWDYSNTNEKKDARKMVIDSFELIKLVLKLQFDNGKLKLDPRIIKFIKSN